MKKNILNDLYKTIRERKKETDLTCDLPDGDNSYTKYLFHSGINKILKKLGEEAAETIVAAKDASAGAGAEDYNTLVTEETADLIYHILVMLAELDIEFSDVESELAGRAKKTGNLKQKK